jgi:hypothetical protein
MHNIREELDELRVKAVRVARGAHAGLSGARRQTRKKQDGRGRVDVFVRARFLCSGAGGRVSYIGSEAKSAHRLKA